MPKTKKKKKGTKDIYQKVIIVIVTILLFFMLFEVTLRITYPLHANYYTEMWRYSTELKKMHEDGGHMHKPSTAVTLYGVEIKTNSIGLRSDIEYGEKETTRILIIGDSLTLGWGVKQEDTFSHLLDQELKNIEIINAGVGNYNTELEKLQLQRLTQLKPDIILLGFYINDLEEVTYPSTLTQTFGKHSYVYVFMRDKITKIKYRIDPNKHFKAHYKNIFQNQDSINKWKTQMTEISQIAKDMNATLIVFDIPEMHKFNPYPFTKEREVIRTFIESELELTYIDILPYLENENPQSLWVSQEDPHPNQKAHKIIANALYKELVII